MAGKTTQLTLKVAAINATSRVFNEISSSASSTIGKIAKWAVGLGAAYLSAKAVASSIQELGKLSDVATAAGASVDELTKLSQALSSVGVQGVKPEELANSFLRLAKTTGKSGLAGFYEVMEAISKLPSEQERAQAATAAFGRSGLQYLRLFSAGADGGMESLKTLVAGMAGVSDAAAESGDKAMDAWGFFSGEAKRLWYEAIGKIISFFDSKFEGGIREAALRGAAHMKYFAKAAWAYIKPFIDNTKASFLQLGEWIARVMSNALTVVGGIIVTSFENAIRSVNGFFYRLAAMQDMTTALVTGDNKRLALAQKLYRENSEKVERENTENWNQTFKVFKDQLKWGLGDGPLGNVNLEPLKKQLEADLKKAHETAVAQKDLQDRMNESTRRKYDGGSLAFAGAAAKNINPEALLGGTYKAVTFALRAGYGTAQEKIARGVEKIAGLLKGVKENTAEMADNLDFGTVEGY